MRLSKKNRIKLENTTERINPKYSNKPLRCGRHCVSFWFEETDYFNSYCEDYGCAVLTEEEFMYKWDNTSDFAVFCPFFKKGIADNRKNLYTKRKGKDRKWLMNLFYKRGRSKFYFRYSEKVRLNEKVEN